MKTLFTVNTTGFTATQRAEVLDTLAEHLHKDFPAYYVAETLPTDFVTAVVVSSTNAKAPIPAHLNGWGLGSLVLQLIA